MRRTRCVRRRTLRRRPTRCSKRSTSWTRNCRSAHVLTMQEIVSESVQTRRFQTLLAGVFAGVSLLLACLGIYGVISYSVTSRTNEIGIRIALGAKASQVMTLVLRQGIRPVFGGLLVGVAAGVGVREIGQQLPIRWNNLAWR